MIHSNSNNLLRRSGDTYFLHVEFVAHNRKTNGLLPEHVSPLGQLNRLIMVPCNRVLPAA